MFRTVPQECFTVHTAMVYVIQVYRQLANRSRTELQDCTFCGKGQLEQHVNFQFCIPFNFSAGKAAVLTEELQVFHQCLHQVNLKDLTNFFRHSLTRNIPAINCK